MPITNLDGTRLKQAVIAAAQRVIQMQEQLNNINVFPVADSDTGTNMAMTLRRVAEGALNCKHGSLYEMCMAIAESALMAARGSSGAILAQFFQGLAEGFRGKVYSDLAGFAEAVQHAARLAREAIAEPCDGTILTVIEDWAQYIYDTRKRVSDFPTLICNSLRVATDSLQRTPEKLEILAKAGVVDAGAQGFVHMLEGTISFIQSGKIERISKGDLTFGNIKAKMEKAPKEITFQFCTQAMVVGTDLDRSTLKEELRPLGNSMVVAGSSERAHVHIHTDDPDQVFAVVGGFGKLVQTKKQDMHSQHLQTHHDPEIQTVAIITDSTCDLPPDEIIRHNIRVVPHVLILGSDTYIDKVTITDQEFYRLISTSSNPPKTSQPAPADFREVYLQAAANHQEAVAILVSGGLSGTLQAAEHAAQAVKDKINVRVIDSKNVGAALGLIVREAVNAIESGAGLQEVREQVLWAIENVRLFLCVETMNYLVQGGRVSKFRGALANLLNLKPILTMNAEGKVEVVAKIVGGEDGPRKLIEIVKRKAIGKHKLRFIVAHADAPDTANYYVEQIRNHFDIQDVPIVSVSPVFGAHAGPGAAAVAFLGENK